MSFAFPLDFTIQDGLEVISESNHFNLMRLVSFWDLFCHLGK